MSAREAATVTQIAPGVRQVSVGAPFRLHVYLIDGPDGAATARAALDAGAVGLNIEDTTDSDEGPLLDTERQALKIRAVRAVGEETGIPLVINARTDVFLAQVGEPERRVQLAAARANSYLAAGADCIFVPGVSDPETIAIHTL